MKTMIYTIERTDGEQSHDSTDYYTSIRAVRRFIHLLIRAGYNEMHDGKDTDFFAPNIKGFAYQTFEKNGVMFIISTEFIGDRLSREI